MAGRDADRPEQARGTQLTYALKWIGGQELGRAGRDRDADIAAAASALSPHDPMAASTVEARLRHQALAIARDELTSVDAAVLHVLFRQNDIVRRVDVQGPPWQLVEARRPQRIGPLRDDIINALALPLGDDQFTRRDRFRRHYENPMYDRVARAIVAAVEPHRIRTGNRAAPAHASGLPTPAEAYRAILKAADRADAMMLAPTAPTEARIEDWLLEWNEAHSDVLLVGSPAVIQQVRELVSIYDRVAASFEISDDSSNPYSEVQGAYMALREEIRRKRGEMQRVVRLEVERLSGPDAERTF
jgi:hypothetical protein